MNEGGHREQRWPKVADITKVKAELARASMPSRVHARVDAARRADRVAGFGSSRSSRGTGIGRNPRTGKEVRIPPGRTIRFKPARNCRTSAGRPATPWPTARRFSPPPENVRCRHGGAPYAPWVIGEQPSRARPRTRPRVAARAAAAHHRRDDDHHGSRALLRLPRGFRARRSRSTTWRELCSAGSVQRLDPGDSRCHEMGHYLACRRYVVDASLPVLPAFRAS